jgi:hypothetical protein
LDKFTEIQLENDIKTDQIKLLTEQLYKESQEKKNLEKHFHKEKE